MYSTPPMRYWGNALTGTLCLCIALVATACASGSTRQEEATATAAAAGMTCMPQPSACGFPDVTNTGVTPGAALAQVNGTVTLDQAGQVYENKVVRGGIAVTAQNVTIRNVRLIATDDYYGIRVTPGGNWDRSDANLLLDHVEIDLNNHYGLKGIAFNGYTARHVFFHNGADCAHFGVNVVIEDSLCVDGPDTNSDGWPDSTTFCTVPQPGDAGVAHFDGFQSDGGRDIVIRHNTLRNPCSQTSNILLSSNTSHISNATITDNLLAGGGYSLYCAGQNTRSTVDHIIAAGNVYSKQYFPKGGYWGPAAYCEFADQYSFVWDGNYVPPPGTGGGGGSTSRGAAKSKTHLTFKRARQITRGALGRHLKRRYTRRPTRLKLSCHRKSSSVINCGVSWNGRPRPGGVIRYAGVVRVRHVKAHKWRYRLQIRPFYTGCACRGKLIKKSRTI